jgi:RNA recognition motif-containing protein
MVIISMKGILIFNPLKAPKICQVTFFFNQKSEVVCLKDIQFQGIFVKNLPYKISEKDIKEFFTKCGEILETEMIMNGRKKFLGHCYIGFGSSESVQKALLLSGHPMSGRFLKIENVSKEKFQFIKANLLERRTSVTKNSGSSGEKDTPDSKNP